jgi:Tfp pilus assembly PilM family ATPase
MSWPFLKNGGSMYVEIRQRSMRVLNGAEHLSLPLERESNGRLTEACQAKLIPSLRSFLKKKNWQPKMRALCAIDARGVSMRQLTLPAATGDQLPRLLKLQIESEFPLPPDALAWGYRALDGSTSATNQELLVVAVKKEVLEEYTQIFAGCGVNLTFTLAALARNFVVPQAAGSYAVLDIGRRHSELVTFEKGVPLTLRTLPWGGENITLALEQRLGISSEEAEKLKLKWDDGAGSNGEIGQMFQAAMGTELDALATLIKANWQGEKLYLTGRSTRYKAMPQRLRERLGGVSDCQRLEPAPAEIGSAAILGLKTATENGSGQAPLILRLKETKPGQAHGHSGQSQWAASSGLLAKARENVADPLLRRWMILAGVLALCCLCFPYAEALVMKPILAGKLDALKSQKGRLKIIDREFGFLQFLKKNQPPYLDALTILANSAAPGTRFDSVSMNRRGELSFRGNLQNSQQVTEFRAKLIKTGFFANVTVEEQTPTPDRQKVNVRISALWKPAIAREQVKIDISPREPSGGGGAFPPGMEEGGGGFPPPFMPGPPMPGPIEGGKAGPVTRGPMPGPSPGPPGVRIERKAGGKIIVPGATNGVETNSASTNSISVTNTTTTIEEIK